MHLLMQPIDANGARALVRTLRRGTVGNHVVLDEIRVSEIVSGWSSSPRESDSTKKS